MGLVILKTVQNYKNNRVTMPIIWFFFLNFATERNPKDSKYDEKTISIRAVRRYDGDVGTQYGCLW